MVSSVSYANDPLLDLLNKRSNNTEAVLKQFNIVTLAPPNYDPKEDVNNFENSIKPKFRSIGNELPTPETLFPVVHSSLTLTLSVPQGPITKLSLLLPINSKGLVYAAAANFHEGCLNGLEKSDIPIQVDLYETDGNPASTVASYTQAIENQSTFIIGPLRKKGVSALVKNYPVAPVPTLLLQPTDADNYYVLTMDIAQEIAELAKLIKQLNYRVLVVSEASTTSRNIKSAFENAWEAISHLPVTHFYIYDQENDWKKLFETIKTVDTVTEENPEPPLYPLAILASGDGKFIESVRNFVPQRFPVFASSIYIGKSNSSFVENLWVMEMPWFLSQHSTDEDSAFISARPSIHQRFYAMGADACRVALESYTWHEGWQFNGFSGDLTLQDNLFNRRGKIVQYQSGVLQLPVPDVKQTLQVK